MSLDVIPDTRRSTRWLFRVEACLIVEFIINGFMQDMGARFSRESSFLWGAVQVLC